VLKPGQNRYEIRHPFFYSPDELKRELERIFQMGEFSKAHRP
jgi:hypothetical protein